MSIALIVNSSPYGTEGPYNALRLASALQLRDQHVEVFFVGDGVHTGRRGQEPGTAHASLEAMLEELIEKGVSVTLCGTCCRTRGIDEADVIEGTAAGTIHQLAELVERSAKVLSF